MPSTATTKPHPPQAEATGAASEIFLSPRVVDEAAFRTFSERLRELVGRADAAQASLDGISGKSLDVLKSLEALTHTQSQRAGELRAALAEVEARITQLEGVRTRVAEDAERITGFEKRSAAQVARLIETGRGVEERAAGARASLLEIVTAAEEQRAELETRIERRLTPRLAELEASIGRAESLERDVRAGEKRMRPLVEAGRGAEHDARRTAEELDGLREQTGALLTAMRSTILECADARDAADSRLERLKGLTASAGTVLETLDQRRRDAEKHSARSPGLPTDLDPVVREIEARVTEAVLARVARAGAAPATDDARVARLEGRVEALEAEVRRLRTGAEDGAPVERKLADIQAALEMLSEVTLRMTTPARTAGTIPAIGVPEPGQAHRLEGPDQMTRTRRSTALPTGAAGELGEPGRSVILWSWCEG